MLVGNLTELSIYAAFWHFKSQVFYEIGNWKLGLKHQILAFMKLTSGVQKNNVKWPNVQKNNVTLSNVTVQLWSNNWLQRCYECCPKINSVFCSPKPTLDVISERYIEPFSRVGLVA